MSDLLKGKRGLVMGVANERSIAWGIAKAMADAGAELAFTYQGEGFGKRLGITRRSSAFQANNHGAAHHHGPENL